MADVKSINLMPNINSSQIQLPTFNDRHILHGVTIQSYGGFAGGGLEGKPELYIEIFKNVLSSIIHNLENDKG